MKSLNEILKGSGLPTATEKVNDDASPIAVSSDDPENEDTICARCGGAGFVRRAVRLGHPDFGKAFPCECTQDEREEHRLARLQRFSNLGPLSRLTFDNLSPAGRSSNPQHQERFSAAANAAQQFAGHPAGWLVFSGPSGCGKTHLAAAIANRCIIAGQAALFMVVPDLLDHLRGAYQPSSDAGYDDLFETLRNAPVLILDDLGSQSSTPWAQEKLFQLINHRYNTQLPTVFTTNLDRDGFDSRTQSRMSDVALSHIYSIEWGPSSGLSGIDALGQPLLRGMTFKTFDTRIPAKNAEQSRDIQKAYQTALNYAHQPKDWLVFAGPTGCGKSRLAAAIGNYCKDAGMLVVFVVVPDLLDRLRATFDSQNPNKFETTFEQVRNVPLLILDDLGAQSGSPWADEKLFQLVNHRYNSCLPTVLTTSVSKVEIEPRLFTRISDPQISSILPIGAVDFFREQQSSASERPFARPRGRPRRA